MRRDFEPHQRFYLAESEKSNTSPASSKGLHLPKAGAEPSIVIRPFGRAARAGFRIETRWTDAKGWFADLLMVVH